MEKKLFNSRSSFLVRIVMGIAILKFTLVVFSLMTTGIGPSIAEATRNTADIKKGLDQPEAPPSSEIRIPCRQDIQKIIQARLRKLDEREALLDEKERELKILEKDIEKRIRELKDIQERLEKPVRNAKEASQNRFRHLVGVYGSMEPSRAAALLDRMDEDTVVRIFAAMKSKKVAKILALMSAERAARISSELSAGRFAGNI